MELLESQVNPAVWEISGHIVLKRRSDYEQATQENAWRLLEEVSLSEAKFEEVKQICLDEAERAIAEKLPIFLESVENPTPVVRPAGIEPVVVPMKSKDEQGENEEDTESDFEGATEQVVPGGVAPSKALAEKTESFEQLVPEAASF